MATLTDSLLIVRWKILAVSALKVTRPTPWASLRKDVWVLSVFCSLNEEIESGPDVVELGLLVG